MTPEEAKLIELERKYKDLATDIEVLKNMSDLDFEEYYNTVMSYDGDDPRAPYEKRNVEYAKDARDKLKALHNNRINKFSKKSLSNKLSSSHDADLLIATTESMGRSYSPIPLVISQFKKLEEEKKRIKQGYVLDMKEDANKFLSSIEFLTALYGLGNGVATHTSWLNSPKLATTKYFFSHPDLYKGSVFAGTGADVGQRILADTPFDKRENEVELLFDAGNLAGMYDLYRFLPPRYDKFGRIVDNVFDKGGYLVNAYDVSKIFW